MLIASGVPCGMNTAGGTLGSKNPGTPAAATNAALASLNNLRELLSYPRGHAISSWDTSSQNWRSRGTRCSGALPAMIAALTAPMEMPASQDGRYPASTNSS